MTRPTLWHRILLAGHLGLFFWWMAGLLWLRPPQAVPRSVALLVLAGPLLLPLRGLLHGRRYTVAWSLFLALGYLAHGIVETWATPSERWFPAIEIGLALAWFVGGIGYIRSGRLTPPAAPRERKAR